MAEAPRIMGGCLVVPLPPSALCCEACATHYLNSLFPGGPICRELLAAFDPPPESIPDPSNNSLAIHQGFPPEWESEAPPMNDPFSNVPSLGDGMLPESGIDPRLLYDTKDVTMTGAETLDGEEPCIIDDTSIEGSSEQADYADEEYNGRTRTYSDYRRFFDDSELDFPTKADDLHAGAAYATNYWKRQLGPKIKAHLGLNGEDPVANVARAKSLYKTIDTVFHRPYFDNDDCPQNCYYDSAVLNYTIMEVAIYTLRKSNIVMTAWLASHQEFPKFVYPISMAVIANIIEIEAIGGQDIRFDRAKRASYYGYFDSLSGENQELSRLSTAFRYSLSARRCNLLAAQLREKIREKSA